MSSDKLYRNPAWISLRPGLPRARPADGEIAGRLIAALGMPGDIFALRYDERDSSHFFAAVRGERLFLKLVPASRGESLLQADAIAAWLAERGLDTVTAFEGFPRRFDEHTWLFSYPYHDARRLAPVASQLARLGQTLARLHRALAAHPLRGTWQQSTHARLRNLVDIRNQIAGGLLAAGPYPAEVARLAADETLDFVRADLASTPLHGDLNAGNVLYHHARVLLLDFEDVFHSVLPPLFELALAAERFVLVAVDDHQLARRLIGHLLAAYRAAGGDIAIADGDELFSAVRSLSLRSLCVLADCQRNGVAIDAAEWRKFLDLAQLASRRRGVLAMAA